MNIKNYFIFLTIFVFISCGSNNDDYYQPELERAKSLPTSDVSFLHISDTHGSSVSVYPMVDILNSTLCDFGIITGDVLADDIMMYYIKSSQKPIFIVPGNHDAYDIPNGQSTFRGNVLNEINKSTKIQYGDDKANYFYADLTKNGKTTRIIGLDQYEIEQVGLADRYNIVMSQHQINWFINLLKDSYDIDGILILIHNGFGNSTYGQRNVENRNSFISTLAYDFDSYLFFGNSYPLMIPDIINAYMTGNNITNKNYPSGYNGVDLKVTTDFIGSHHNFIGFLGGHVHWDLCEYLKNYPSQLQLLMCYSGLGTGKYMDVDFNDIIKSSYGIDSYNINYNVIDYRKQQLTIYRLGANKLCTGGTRDSIGFEINK